MTILELCEWLESTRLAVLIQESPYGFPLVVAVHILGLTFSVGTLLWVDLRMLGLAVRGLPVSQVYRGLAPWFLAGFTAMLVSGATLFTAFATAASLACTSARVVSALVLSCANCSFEIAS